MIEKNEKDIYINHLWNVLSRDYRSKGEIMTHQIKFWKQGFWNKTIYPVFTFEFNNDNHLVNISDRVNPIGKTINLLISIMFSGVLLTMIINDHDLRTNFIFYFLFTVIVLIMVFLFKKVYTFEKNNQLELIYDLLDIEIEDNKTENEWSSKKIATRIIMYPICIGLIWLGIFFLFPEGELILGIGCLGIAGAYLFSDINILIKKNN